MGKMKLTDEFTYSEYMTAITKTKKSLKVGSKYSPYLVNKSLMNMFVKTKNVDGIMFLNKMNMTMGGMGKVSPNHHVDLSYAIPKQWHFDYVMNTHLTDKE